MDLSSHDEMEHDSEIHHMMAHHHHHHHRRVSEQQRRQSGMSIEEERERRASIKDIMQDPDLTPLERRQSIQSLMDGRRRSSRPFGGGAAGMSMAAAAAAAAADFEDSSDDEDDMQDDTPHVRDTRHSDSTVSSSSTPTGEVPSQFFMPPPPGQMARSASISAFPATTNGQGTTALQQQDMCHECTTNTTTANASSKILEEARPPCSHYERRCSLVAPCCGLAFGCRICHDECPVLPTPMEPGKRRKSLPLTLEPDLEHHCIDRFAITQVICRECFTKQDSKTNKCISCGIQFGKYHCATCNLWMSDEEDPYHCDECGFCRVGGRDKFRHCRDCGMCIDAQLFENHNCKAGKYMSSCPVCQEDLFSSRFASHEMPCGHAIHWHCFKELTSYDTRCPVCKKTAETREQMAATWSAMAMGISLQPIPPEMARLVTIICNDCEERDENRQWHFLGVQCRKCTSFNTIVEEITAMGPEAVGAGVSPPVPPPQHVPATHGSLSHIMDSVTQGNVNYVSQLESMDES